MTVMRKLCFFFPDVVATRLTEALKRIKAWRGAMTTFRHWQTAVRP